MGRKGTQRERLLTGMTEVAVQEGYAAASVARVIARAGVSRPTFYEYFTDREDCFLSTHRALASDLLDRVRVAVGEQKPERAVQGAVAAIVDLACSKPGTACFLMQEAMAAGPGARDERDRTIAVLAKIVEDARAKAAPEARTPDLSAGAIVGGIYRLLTVRLRRGERDIGSLLGDLERWLEAYEQPMGEHRWRILEEGMMPEQTPRAPEPSGPGVWHAPPALPRGRSRLSEGEMSQNQRERIIFAAVQVAHEQGYAGTTIADIAAAARLDRRVFYQHFQDKQEAFLSALERGVQQTIAVAAGGFFSAPTWPERVWEAGDAATRFLANNVVLCNVGFIEAYAIGPAAVHRFEDLRTAFTIFLQEGYQYQRDQTVPASPPMLEAIAATTFELAYHLTRGGRAEEVGRLLPHVTHLCLAPFIGADASNEFIEAKRDQAPRAAPGSPATD
jgi:AcrR family transcriptional regulator